MAAARPTAINLLTQDEFSYSMVGKVLLWALSIGRYIVVFTELIVILSFLSRFKLDRDLTDINEEINRQKAMIMAYGDLQDRFEYVQAQLQLVKSVRVGMLPFQVTDFMEKIQPTDIKLLKLTATASTLDMSGVALSAPSFSVFIKRLAANPNITDVIINSISSKDEGLTIEFSLSASLALVQG